MARARRLVSPRVCPNAVGVYATDRFVFAIFGFSVSVLPAGPRFDWAIADALFRFYMHLLVSRCSLDFVRAAHFALFAARLSRFSKSIKRYSCPAPPPLACVVS